MGAYGLTTTINTGSSADAWAYSFTEPDPLTAVVQLDHPSTVRAPSAPAHTRTDVASQPFRLAGVAIRSGPQVTLGPGNAYYLELQNVRASSASRPPFSRLSADA